MMKSLDGWSDGNDKDERQKPMWDTAEVKLLTKLWAKGHSAGHCGKRLGYSRSAVCGKLQRLGLKRGHMPPTAKPKIISIITSVPKRPVSVSLEPVKAERMPTPAKPVRMTKKEMYAMLAGIPASRHSCSTGAT
jgi:GcrA cell cycle regulator